MQKHFMFESDLNIVIFKYSWMKKFPKCSLQNRCHETAIMPRADFKTMASNVVSHKHSVLLTEMEEGKKILWVCVSRMEKKREESLKLEEWKSWLGGTSPFAAQHPAHAGCMVVTCSPVLPAAEGGREPALVSVLLWPRSWPCAKVGTPLSRGCGTALILPSAQLACPVARGKSPSSQSVSNTPAPCGRLA